MKSKQARTAAETRNLFETAGKKQTAQDFKPAPDKITTNFGDLEFVGGAFPTVESAQKLYDELDLQRATQAYMDFYSGAFGLWHRKGADPRLSFHDRLGYRRVRRLYEGQ